MKVILFVLTAACFMLAVIFIVLVVVCLFFGHGFVRPPLTKDAIKIP
jgi:hypothetical protein